MIYNVEFAKLISNFDDTLVYTTTLHGKPSDSLYSYCTTANKAVASK